MKPLIGMPCALMQRGDGLLPVYGAIPAYVHAVEAAGGVPVLLPLWEQQDALATLRGRLDGLLLMGGGDVDPALYGEDAIPETQPPEGVRDELELELVRQALADDLPLLGVCRGLQVLNVAQGGTLVQHIPTQLPDAINHEVSSGGHDDQHHPIAIEPGSRLAEIVGATSHAVNSYHHQAIGRLGRDVRVVARTEDGVVEAAELPDRTFALAVQFHPERMVEGDPAMRRLFAAFVAACQARAGDAAGVQRLSPAGVQRDTP
jgi:putative glutamine amidotransferase